MLRNGWGRWHKAGATLLVALSAILLGSNPGTVHARGPFAQAAADTIAVAQLPPQGRSMLTLIYQGGPFRHDKDGVVFGNRERLLAVSARSYYREYTVRTPGERSRGARRIVCGGLEPAAPDACFYTDDHYASFRKIVP
ncbi:MAG: ribonuclease [Pseudomonadota bacterium]|nr:ribonuclease [Pseudomonadota bacterium]